MLEETNIFFVMMKREVEFREKERVLYGVESERENKLCDD